MPRRRLDRDDPLPVFEQTRAATLIDPFPRRDHNMGRHSDADGDGLADQADPETLRAASTEPWCEDRADPDSWDDPAIVDEPEDPHAVAD